ncbi:MAG: mechanosensitive ion channel family protein, partial [Cyclobacteriaceae bacterium]
MTEPIIRWIEEHWMIPESVQLKIFYSLIAILVVSLLRFLANKVIYKSFTDVKVRYMWKNWVKNSTYFILLVVIMTIWLERIGSVATFLGLVSAGLAIALQSPIVNLAGWLFII